MASTKNSSNGSDHPVLLIDGECVLCNRLAQFVIRHDPAGRFRFAALQSEAARRLLAERGLPPPPAGTFVCIEDGKSFTRSEAALRLARHLPFPWRAAVIARLIPRALRDAAYDFIARNRIRFFGRTAACGLLSTEERSRFLE